MPEPIFLLEKTGAAMFVIGPLLRLMEQMTEKVYADPLAAIAILIGVVGIWRAEQLFNKLVKTQEHLIGDMKNGALDQAISVTASYAAFRRAMQAVEIDPGELPEDAAFALFTTFHFQSVRFSGAKPADVAKLRKDTRASIDKDARGYIDMLINSGLAKRRAGVDLIEPTN